MSRAEELIALAERVEALAETAGGVGFSVNAEIHRLCGDYDCGDDEMPDYTGSLDAAMTLVPEGWVFGLIVHDDPEDATAGMQRSNPYADSHATAATPALALTAAALFARAKEVSQ